MIVNIADRRVVFVLALELLLSACSSNSPDGTLIQFYKNLNRGEYSRAKELYTTEAREFVDARLPGDNFNQWADMETRKGTISDVRVNTAHTVGERSDVSFIVAYKDGGSANRTVTLKQEDGYWKLGLVRE